MFGDYLSHAKTARPGFPELFLNFIIRMAFSLIVYRAPRSLLHLGTPSLPSISPSTKTHPDTPLNYVRFTGTMVAR